MYDLEFNGRTASSMGIRVAKRPDIPAPKKRVKLIEIPGRDGNLTESDGTYEDIEIEVEMNFVATKLSVGERFRTVKSWLLNEKGKLIFTDDNSVYYKVKRVVVDTFKREAREAGTFNVVFVCEPYTFLKSGSREHSITETFNNVYEIAHPKYLITGEGMCTLTVNGKSVKANVGQNLTIDTELMLAYRSDGTLKNTALTGSYEDLYLRKGNNTISASAGFTVKIIPNWRCL